MNHLLRTLEEKHMPLSDTATLTKLSDSNQTIGNPDEDVRGRSVKDKDGHGIGKVNDLLSMIRIGENGGTQDDRQRYHTSGHGDAGIALGLEHRLR